MIIHSYDDQTPPIIGPGDFYGPKGSGCELCILTFSHIILEAARQRFPLRETARIAAATGPIPIYTFDYQGHTIALCLCGIGAVQAGTNVIEINWLTGAGRFIMFGSAGSLNRAATAGKYVLPTEAYRDEGMSYHYAPPTDYIAVKNAGRMEALFRELGLPCVTGRVWTTDAFYRETRGQVMQRQAEGCIAVEMELAGVQAVCDFHGFELYNFLVTGDVLDAPEYDRGTLPSANHDLDKLQIALELAKRL